SISRAPGRSPIRVFCRIEPRDGEHRDGLAALTGSWRRRSHPGFGGGHRSLSTSSSPNSVGSSKKAGRRRQSDSRTHPNEGLHPALDGRTPYSTVERTWDFALRSRFCYRQFREIGPLSVLDNIEKFDETLWSQSRIAFSIEQSFRSCQIHTRSFR